MPGPGVVEGAVAGRSVGGGGGGPGTRFTGQDQERTDDAQDQQPELAIFWQTLRHGLVGLRPTVLCQPTERAFERCGLNSRIAVGSDWL